jgi:hypothetical protein
MSNKTRIPVRPSAAKPVVGLLAVLLLVSVVAAPAASMTSPAVISVNERFGLREVVDGAEEPDPSQVGPQHSWCSAVSGNRWWTVTVKCEWICPHGAHIILAVLGGTAGVPYKVNGEADCADVECENVRGIPACMDWGYNDGLTKSAVCMGTNTAPGRVNVAVECQGFGCGAACDFEPTGESYSIDAPGFSMEDVVAGDEVCMPMPAGAPSCLVVGATSIVLFNGPEDYLPQGVRCFAASCEAVTFQ